MSGRGRKPRGRRKDVADDVRGENVPPPVIQPPVLYPPLEFKPVPLIINEEENYLLALKQELRGTLRDSGFYVQPVLVKKDIERYSDKYQQKDPTGNDIKWDFSRFPKELKEVVRRKKAPRPKKPVVSRKRKKPASSDEVKSKLERLESAEKSESSEEEREEEKEEDEEEGEKDEEELYDEEEQEEGTDYAVNYFDNGEEYLDEDDNLDDGPVY